MKKFLRSALIIGWMTFDFLTRAVGAGILFYTATRSIWSTFEKAGAASVLVGLILGFAGIVINTSDALQRPYHK
jgi:hypothetical protein